MDDLVAFVRRCLDEDERVAVAASQDMRGGTLTGEHWRWECGNCDTVQELTPVTVLDEAMQCPACESYQMALRSEEKYPTASTGSLSHFAVSYAEEQEPMTALHIVRHDPARVLREVVAKRAIVDLCDATEDRALSPDAWVVASGIIRHLAAVYCDRDGYKTEWAPE